jgi:hypothetical protein
MRTSRQPGEAEFFVVLGHVELLVRWRSWNGSVPIRVPRSLYGRRIVHPAEPVGVDMIACHVAEEESIGQPPPSQS